ncbi:45156_t:CDS:1, partial [Gigaspora margarita]
NISMPNIDESKSSYLYIQQLRPDMSTRNTNQDQMPHPQTTHYLINLILKNS